MRNKVIISTIAALLFVTGATFIWKEKNLLLDPPQVIENRISTRLVKALTTDPKTVAWSASNLSQRIDFPGDFSIYDQAVHWNDQRIVDADAKTFALYDKNYAHDDKTIFYQGFAPGGARGDIFIIQGADIITFTSVGNGYAKDKSHVYYRGGEIEDADPETFEVVELVDNILYAKDKQQVYFQNEKIDGFDASTFRILKKTGWFPIFLADKNKVAIGRLSEDPPADKAYKFEVKTIDGADPNSFVILGGMWGKDTRHVFYETQVVPKADLETFQVLGTSNNFDTVPYARDKNNVYYFGKRVEGANAESFRVVEDVMLTPGNFGEDMHSAYKDGESFPKQDLRSFQAGKIPLSAKNLGSNYYLYYGNIYHCSPPIQAAAYFAPVYANRYTPKSIPADVATFQVFKDGYARDKEYVYYEGEITLTYDPDKTFVLLSDGYSKTNTAVFLHNNAIEGAQPDSFEILSLGYAKDARSVFYNDERVEGADPASFKILGRGLSSEHDDWRGGWYYYNYARDTQNIFCEESQLTDADRETFTLKGKNGMPQDKNHSFDGCEVKN